MILRQLRPTCNLRQPKIHNLNLPLFRHHNIAGFNIPMHNPLLMRRLQPFGDLGGVIDNFIHPW